MKPFLYIALIIFVFLRLFSNAEGSPVVPFKEGKNHNQDLDSFRNSELVYHDLVYLIESVKLAATSYPSIPILNFSLRENPNLVDAWKVLNDAGLDHLRKNTDFLKTTSSYTDGSLTRKFEQYGLSLEEESIIRHYTGPSHSQLNQALDGAGEVTPELAQYKDVLNQSLNKLPDHQGVVYRGLGDTKSLEAKNWVVGDEITMPSFTSTSRSIDEADNFMFNGGGDVSLIVNSKTGKAIDNVSLEPNELEVLFQSGKKFRVDEVTIRARIVESDPLIKEITLTEL